MAYYWIELKNGKRMCVDAPSQMAAKAITEMTLNTEVEKVIGCLPYAAFPQVRPIGEPAFCSSPDKCAGRSSCPRDYSCTE